MLAQVRGISKWGIVQMPLRSSSCSPGQCGELAWRRLGDLPRTRGCFRGRVATRQALNADAPRVIAFGGHSASLAQATHVVTVGADTSGMQDEQILSALIEVASKPGEDVFDGDPGAFTNFMGRARDEQTFRRLADDAFDGTPCK